MVPMPKAFQPFMTAGPPRYNLKRMNMPNDMLLHLRRAFPVQWHMERKCRLPVGRMDEPYFVSFDPGSGLFGERWDAFDASGVLCKGAYNAVSIAQYALYCYERFCQGDDAARAAFLRQVAYLCAAQQSDGTYRYDFPHQAYGVAPGWISGLAQGEAFSVFLRAYALTKRGEFLDRGHAALSSFERAVENGGVTYVCGDDVFFEEMPGRVTHILNGHVSAAFAVWEAIRYGIATPALQQLHDRAIDTLVRWLPLYDADGWSFYELAVQGNRKRRYVPITYHQTHIAVLHVYAAITGRAEFARMSERWRRGLNRWDVRARVWRDSMEWVAESAVRRLYRAPAGSWRSLPTDTAPAV
jgi:hypothetical protein